MCLRQVIDYSTPLLIKKVVPLKRKIQRLDNLNELIANKEYFTKREYLMLYQQFLELDIYDSANWKQRKILAPIIDFTYDHNNAPVLVYPKFQPLATETEAFRLDEDEAVAAIQSFLTENSSMEDEEIGNFINDITDFCDSYDLRQDDVLLNLSNLGYSPIFGPRIIDYGLDYDVAAYFMKRDNEDE